MDGIDEGLFSWFTINFLLGIAHLLHITFSKFNLNIFADRLNDPHNTFATLDLGGGSTQITFAPKGTRLQFMIITTKNVEPDSFCR
jgi:ectonucleoside triphosphate diphosphohydrolase 5/6